MIELLQRTRMVIIKNPCTLLTRNVHNLYILKTTTVNGQPIFEIFSRGYSIKYAYRYFMFCFHSNKATLYSVNNNFPVLT